LGTLGCAAAYGVRTEEVVVRALMTKRERKPLRGDFAQDERPIVRESDLYAEEDFTVQSVVDRDDFAAARQAKLAALRRAKDGEDRC